MVNDEGQDPLDRVGHTPLMKVTRLDTGPCELFLKLESHNPGGSIKNPANPAAHEATTGPELWAQQSSG